MRVTFHITEWQQIFVLLMFALNIIMNIVKHNKPRDDNYNAYAAVVSRAIWLYVLYTGGFFS